MNIILKKLVRYCHIEKLWAASGTRLHIAYTVSLVSEKLDMATDADWSSVKKIFRYLKGTASDGIMYMKSNKNFEAYSDSDYAGCVATHRSILGVVCKYTGGSILWQSTKQKVVS